MVKFPKQIKTHCKSCNSHKIFTCSQYKQGKASNTAQGNRRYAAKQTGYKGQTKPILRRKSKQTKKIVVKLVCQTCRAIRMKVLGRAKHFEITISKK